VSCVIPFETVYLLVLILLASACNSPTYSPPDNPVDAAPDGGSIEPIESGEEGGIVDSSRAGADGGLVDPGLGARDAGPDSAVFDDGGTTLVRPEPPGTPMVPTSAPAELLGRYAIQIRFYGQDSTLGTIAPMVNELIMLASIEADATSGKLQMTSQLCRDRGEVRGPFSQVFAAVVRPDLQPPRTWDLIVQDGSFRTDGPPALIGYDEPAPTGCSAGVKLKRRAEQVWLGDANAVCSCPSSETPPTQPDDCRVNDLDGDTHPGVTIALSGAAVSQDYVRFKDSSQFVGGIIATGKRHRASYAKLEELYQLDCAPRSCTRANLRACAAQYNTAWFTPLPELATGDAPWTCASLMKEVDEGKHVSPEPLDPKGGC